MSTSERDCVRDHPAVKREEAAVREGWTVGGVDVSEGNESWGKVLRGQGRGARQDMVG